MSARAIVAASAALVLLAAGAAAQEIAKLQEIEQLLDQKQAKQAVQLAHKVVAETPDDPNAWFILARAEQASGNLDGAIKAGHKASEFPAVRASAFYNLACAYAVKGDREDAFKALLGAKRAGFADREQMAGDPDLKSLHEDARFQLPQQRNYFTLKLKDGSDLAFSVDLPVGYDPARAYPVLVAPGHGKKVDGNWGGLFWGEDTSQRGWITVESPAFLMTDPIGITSQLLDEVARRYKVEGGKFHFACYGPSSGPAFAAAMAYPNRVKSLSALPGYPVTDKAEELAKLRGLRVSLIVGEQDAIWRPEVEVAHSRLQKAGVDCYLEVVPASGHLLQGMFGGELAERLQLMR